MTHIKTNIHKVLVDKYEDSEEGDDFKSEFESFGRYF